MSPLRIYTVARRSFLDTALKASWWLLVGLVLLLAVMLVMMSPLLIPSQRGVVRNSAAALSLGHLMAGSLLVMPMATILFGLRVTRDHASSVHRLLFATGLRPWEHLAGHAVAASALLLLVLGPLFVLSVLCVEFGPPRMGLSDGAFSLVNYLGAAALMLWLPAFASGAIALAVGARSGRAGAVMFCWVPLLAISFFADWNPEWLPRWIDAALVVLDPTGSRWFQSTLMQVNRGSTYYNTASFGTLMLEGGGMLLLNRLLLVAAGVAALMAAARAHARIARPTHRVSQEGVRAALASPAPGSAQVRSEPLPRVECHRAGLLASTAAVATSEIREIVVRPGIWAWIVLISTAAVLWATEIQDGIIGEVPAVTASTFATNCHSLYAFMALTLTLPALVGIMRRSEESRIDAILNQTRVPTAALVLGRFLAAFTPSVLLLGSAFPTMVAAALLQSGGHVTAEMLWPAPIFGCWLVFILPGVAFWIACIMLMGTVVRSHAAVLGTGALLLGWITLAPVFRAEPISWWKDWALLSGQVWSDLAPLEFQRTAVVLNRLGTIGIAATALALSVRCWPRQTPDAAAMPPLQTRVLRAVLAPSVLLPTFASGICMLGLWIHGAYALDSGQMNERMSEYHSHNLQTWLRAPQPTVEAIDLEVELDPRSGSFEARTRMQLVNEHDHPLQRFAITLSPYWEIESLRIERSPRPLAFWSSGTSALLQVAYPTEYAGDVALEPGESCLVVAEYRSDSYALGYQAPADPQTFMLPGGGLLTSLSLDLVPLVGFLEWLGGPEDLKPFRPEAGAPAQRTRAFFGSGRPLHLDAKVRIPAEYRANLPGVLLGETVEGGWRTMQWRTDKPITELFHIVIGRWVESKGERTSIWHSPRHTRNVPSMLEALDGAREHYSKWFGEYPWKELRLSEFPGLVDYAQSGETNIVFSESMGFRALATADLDAAFSVTAHEAAHQWWGGMLVPGEGPGGNILSEGLAEYSAMRLIGTLRGERMRQAHMRHAERRLAELSDRESPWTLANFDDGASEAYTLLYHKGPWVFWMLADMLGEEASDAAHRQFIAENRETRDHPLLPDYIATMRAHATDKDRFDQFVREWIDSPQIGDYRIDALDSRPIAPDQGPAGGEPRWRSTVRVHNIGAVTMPIEVAVTNGRDRWSSDPAEPYRDERASAVIGPDIVFEFTIETPFEPVEAVVDPDVRVLQMNRQGAAATVRGVRDDTYADRAPGKMRRASAP